MCPAILQRRDTGPYINLTYNGKENIKVREISHKKHIFLIKYVYDSRSERIDWI